jgi:hypothetical protein
MCNKEVHLLVIGTLVLSKNCLCSVHLADCNYFKKVMNNTKKEHPEWSHVREDGHGI